jgi:hypothetical protein
MKKQSAYAAKRDSGNQMYGPGCGANKLTPERLRAIRTQAGTLRPGTYYVTAVEQEVK